MDALGLLLDPHVRWGGDEETEQTCHNPTDVMNWFRRMIAAGLDAEVNEVVMGDEHIVLGLIVRRPEGDDGPTEGYQVYTLRNGLIVDIRGFEDRRQATERAGIAN